MGITGPWAFAYDIEMKFTITIDGQHRDNVVMGGTCVSFFFETYVWCVGAEPVSGDDDDGNLAR